MNTYWSCVGEIASGRSGVCNVIGGPRFEFPDLRDKLQALTSHHGENTNNQSRYQRSVSWTGDQGFAIDGEPG